MNTEVLKRKPSPFARRLGKMMATYYCGAARRSYMIGMDQGLYVELTAKQLDDFIRQRTPIIPADAELDSLTFA